VGRGEAVRGEEEEAALCEEMSGHRRRQENDEAAVLVKREHPGRAVVADAARHKHLDRTAAFDSAAAACHLWSAFDLMTRRKDPLDGLKLYSGDEHYWFVSSSSSSSPPLDPHVHPPFLFHGCFLI
jgi:hypothetical protein